jgi:predicted RNA binding protein YcfA (HicA-like mRNA interferase family)
MTSNEVIDALEADGWILNRVRGSHHIFKHPLKSGHVTVLILGRIWLLPQSKALNDKRA